MVASRSSKRRNGFTLVELLVYISLYFLLALLLYPGTERFDKMRQRMEMENFCQSFAADITALQQVSFWHSTLQKQSKITLDLSSQSYAVYRSGLLNKVVNLKKISQGKLYFYSPNTSVIRFSDEGAPQAYFAVQIKNRQLPQLVKKIEVQPVTGRVVISDSK